MPVRSLLKKKVWLGLTIALLAGVVATATGRLRGMDLAEQLYYDLWHQMDGVRYLPEHVVLIVVDDRTLLEHQDEPMVFWGPHFARAVEKLGQAGVRAVGLDFLFLSSAESWLERVASSDTALSRTYDIPMRTQLASGRVVLAGNVVSGGSGKKEVVLPVRDYLFSLPRLDEDVGLTNFHPDSDGVTRKFIPQILDDTGAPLGPTFAFLLSRRFAEAQSGGTAETAAKPAVPETTPPFRIGFSGPPGSIPRVSMARLLNPEAEIASDLPDLHDKVAIIGCEYTGVQDIHQTPYSRAFFSFRPRMMTGPELHANILETLLARRTLQDVSPGIHILCLAALLCFGAVLFFRLPPWAGLGTACLLALSWAGLAFLLFRSGWILPVAAPQFGLGLCYMGTLGARFTGEEKERKRIRKIFGRYVSDGVVEEILASGDRVDPGGATLRVTVLFSDIRNFTTISEKLDAHEVVEMLNAYFSRVCDPVMNEGGTVDKFIGDAVMAVFGSPRFHPDHALRAVRAALGMAEQARLFSTWMKERFPDRALPDFRIGIGIHTGEAVVGSIGSPRRMEFTAIGDTVNVASRLESVTKELGWDIVASGDCIRSAGPCAVTGRREEVFVKGRGKPVEVFEVTGYLDT